MLKYKLEVVIYKRTGKGKHLEHHLEHSQSITKFLKMSRKGTVEERAKVEECIETLEQEHCQEQ